MACYLVNWLLNYWSLITFTKPVKYFVSASVCANIGVRDESVENYNVSEEILEEDGKGETNPIIMGEWNSEVGDKSYQNNVRPHVR